MKKDITGIIFIKNHLWYLVRIKKLVIWLGVNCKMIGFQYLMIKTYKYSNFDIIYFNDNFYKIYKLQL